MSDGMEERPGTKLHDVTAERLEKPSQGEMKELTRQFLSSEGAFAKLQEAVDALNRQFLKNVYKEEWRSYFLTGAGQKPGAEDNKYAMESHIHGLNMDEVFDVLISHNGLKGEFGNGVGNFLSLKEFVEENTELGNLFDTMFSSAARSVLSKSALTKEATQIAEKLGITKENKLQALYRCADQIEKWVEVNKATLGDEQVKEFGAVLGEYKQALEAVQPFLNRALAYVEQGKEGEPPSPR